MQSSVDCLLSPLQHGVVMCPGAPNALTARIGVLWSPHQFAETVLPVGLYTPGVLA